MQDPQTQTELKLAKYYLVNLAFYFIPLFIMPVSPWQWLASLLGFAALYLLLFSRLWRR